MDTSAKVKTILGRALEIEASRRAPFLDAACRGDAELRAEVDALLSRAGQLGDFMAQDAAAGMETDFLSEKDASTESESIGDRVGPYTLTQLLGSGGMGSVYLAEQSEPVRRQVALKMVKLGMDSKQVIARFEAERQALAMMDHPNIAKVFDAGTAQNGRPYFVMELVRGVQLTKYCDTVHLPLRERLRLFTQACRAIQHAHQKGIIHRDVKPSNVLVALHDDKPVVKVIDFGVAKAINQSITDESMFTQAGAIIGTLEYMSPEQAELNAMGIDARSDIYSLGVLLYELLTGSTPLDHDSMRKAAFLELLRMIREVDPPRPSTRISSHKESLSELAVKRGVASVKLTGMLRGDLDWITMKALEKNRARRYETADGLARDVERYLEDKPVEACPPTLGYTALKFMRRHKGAVGAAAALLLTVFVGSGASVWQAVRAKHAEFEATTQRNAAAALAKEQGRLRAKAEKAETDAVAQRKQAVEAAAKSRQIATFLEEMLKSVGPSVALGRDTKMLREILDNTAERLTQLKEQPEAEAELLASLGKVYMDLGEYPKAKEMFERALMMRTTLLGEQHLVVANSLYDLAEVYFRQANYNDSEQLHRKALVIRRRLLAEPHADIAYSLNRLAEAVKGSVVPDKRREDFRRRYTEAEGLYREALAMRRKLFGNEHADVAQSLNDLGLLLWGIGNRTDAEAAHREALAIRLKVLGKIHPDVATSLNNLALAVRSESLHREALAMRRAIYKTGHPDLAYSLYNLAQSIFNDEANFSEAEALLREALAMRAHLLGYWHVDTNDTIYVLVALLRKRDKIKEIEALYREQVVVERQLLEESAVAPLNTIDRLVAFLQEQKKWTDIENVYLSELKRAEEHTPAIDDTLLRQRLAQFYEHMGWVEKMLPAMIAESESKPQDVYILLKLAGFQAWLGRDAELANLCRPFIESAEEWTDWPRVEVVAKSYCLRPSTDHKLMEHVLTLARRTVESGRDKVAYPWFLTVLGMAEFRNGDDAAAQKALSAALKSLYKDYGLQETAGLYYAMTLFRQGKVAEARQFFAEAEALMKPYPEDEKFALKFGSDRDVMVTWLAYKEARTLLQLGKDWRNPRAEANAGRVRADRAARQGHWKDAADYYLHMVALEPGNQSHYHNLSPLLAQIGDLNALRKLCASSTAYFGTSDDSSVADRLAKDCLLVPSIGADTAIIYHSIERALVKDVRSGHLAFTQFAKGLLEYRLGQYDSAEEWINKTSPKAESNSFQSAQAFFVLAMAQCQQSRRDEARFSFQRGAGILGNRISIAEIHDLGRDWGDWLMSEVLRREAQSMLYSQ